MLFFYVFATEETIQTQPKTIAKYVYITSLVYSAR